MDIWIALHPENARRVVDTLRDFGFDTPQLGPDLFLQSESMVRMGNVPLRIEILTSISGVTFDECYAERVVDTLDGVEVSIISLPHLRANKQASGRYKTLKSCHSWFPAGPRRSRTEARRGSLLSVPLCDASSFIAILSLRRSSGGSATCDRCASPLWVHVPGGSESQGDGLSPVVRRGGPPVNW
jgi:hypothetical protein